MEYQEYEFCKSVKCLQLINGECIKQKPHLLSSDCVHTAKEFHKWLDANNYRIIKKNDKQGNPILPHTIKVK